MSSSQAAIILEAVKSCIESDIIRLRALVALNEEILGFELVLRIILTYLPESVEAAVYVPFLRDLVLRDLTALDDEGQTSIVNTEINEYEARSRVQNLQLLPLQLPTILKAEEADTFTKFLIIRAYRIEEETGSLLLVQQLVEPFLSHSNTIRSWAVSTLLPLLRLNYDYYSRDLSLDTFQRLHGVSALDELLEGASSTNEVWGRDLRGVVGPWMQGEISQKRRKLNDETAVNVVYNEEEDITPLTCWDYVNNWVQARAEGDLKAVVSLFEQWGGPQDADFGGWLDDDDRADKPGIEQGRQNYVQTGFSTIYTAPDSSMVALDSIQAILIRATQFENLPRPPDPRSAMSSVVEISPSMEFIASLVPSQILSQSVRNPSNALTRPSENAVQLASFLLASAHLTHDLGQPMSLKNVLSLCLFSTASDQKLYLRKILSNTGSKHVDDSGWVARRGKLLWLRNNSASAQSNDKAIGLLSKVTLSDLEGQILKAMITTSRTLSVRCSK